MTCPYKYANEIEYDFSLLKPEDYDKLQAFSCGNEVLDAYIHRDVIKKENEHFYVNCEDGLHFKIWDKKTGAILGFVSLAASAIVFNVDTTYTTHLSAVKIDVFAINEKYQKLHYDEESATDPDSQNHYYFSDEVMGSTLLHIKNTSENNVLINYIFLYSDKEKVHFYERNHFERFHRFMVGENTQEIRNNIPMYIRLE